MARQKHPGQLVLRVTLEHITPPIWRRLMLPGDATLAALHLAIQRAMPWLDYHLHMFSGGAKRYTDPRMAEGDEQDEGSVALEDVFPEAGAKLVYVYDFGDDWVHSVVAEGRDPDERRGFLCIDGARAAPPEDCGGPFGYEELLVALADPSHERHDELVEWIGGCRAEFVEHDERFRGPFDPEAFDVGEVNRALSDLRIGYDVG